ncbi:MAG: hypothetical protein IKA95_00730 [Clostridia bacterium]|nr:hypothetical protein [Clostridia bacterium]
MKFCKYLISFILMVSLLFALGACSGISDPSDSAVYISVDSKPLTKEYIGYFFYVAQSSMLSEAGHTTDNSTDEDIALYWQTTEIEGKNAVEVARDVAADNAVFQTVQYLKAVAEGILLTSDEQAAIDADVASVVTAQGGEEAFSALLADMGTNMQAYKQIITENAYISKLYSTYDANGLLDISDAELLAFSEAHAEEFSPDMMLDAAKKEKFNAIAKQWEKDAEIFIDDEAMKQFEI